jgi:hypothetical protein
VGGGFENQATFDGSTVGGGFHNVASGTSGGMATVAGGYKNHATGDNSAVGGGDGNVASGTGSFIGGGGYDGNNASGNQVTGGGSAIGGGVGNAVASLDSVIGGGQVNTIQTGSDNSTIAGGINNTINTGSGYAFIGGGKANTASGSYSFAAGQQAQAVNQGAFVWADSQNAAFASTANDSFNIRAQGGVFLDNSTPAINFGGATKQMLNLYGNGFGIGVQSDTEYFRSVSGYAWFKGGSHNDNQNNPGGGTVLMTLDNSGNLECKGTISGNIALTSDRNLKENFMALDAQSVLAKVAALSVEQWNYKTEGQAVRHVGPMAQDFHAAFGLDGADDKHIFVVDEGGVALAAIQGLDQKVNEKDAKIQEQGAEIAALKQSVAELKALVEKLANK